MNDVVRPGIDPALFRQVMGRFATGVTVVSVEQGEGVRGMTANAFLSGSLAPPLCVVSIAKRARMHPAMLAATHFGVSFLAEDQVALSEHFAGRGPSIAVPFERFGPTMVLASAAGRIAAETDARHDCGDHTLFIGRILAMDGNDRRPLLYYAGRYRSLAGEPADIPADVPDIW